MASRHRSRELAVQICYQLDLDPSSFQDERVLDRFWKEQAQTSQENREFFDYLAKGVAEHLPAIDRALEETLKNWKMSRVEKVDLSILRIATFELLFGSDKPDSAVVINEAVELSKRFGTQNSPAFVNGILDSVAGRKSAS